MLLDLALSARRERVLNDATTYASDGPRARRLRHHLASGLAERIPDAYEKSLAGELVDGSLRRLRNRPQAQRGLPRPYRSGQEGEQNHVGGLHFRGSYSQDWRAVAITRDEIRFT
jgi:hypothetical protein